MIVFLATSRAAIIGAAGLFVAGVIAAPGHAAVPGPAAATAAPPVTQAPTGKRHVLIAAGSVWRIAVRGIDLRRSWRHPRYTGHGWRPGAAPLGFGAGDERTLVQRGRRPVYLRKAFRVAGPTSALRLRAQIDDGAAFYLNGQRVARKRLPARASDRSRATTRVEGAAERRWATFRLPPTLVRPGRNVLAVELHNRGGRDLRFDATLVRRTASPPPTQVLPSTSTASEPGPVQRAASVVPDDTRVRCRIDDPRLREISGMATSVRFPEVVWVHNDSGDAARVFAVDANSCAVRATVTLAGVTARDFEAMSIGRGSAGEPVIWVGDTGDNYRVRSQIELYHFPEPAELRDQAVPPQRVTVTWSDGARDCESLIVEPVPNGRVFLISKEASSGVYQLRGDFRSTGSATTGSRIGSTRNSATDAATSPDRSLTVVRFGDYGTVFQGLPGSSARNFRFPPQQQGEAVTFTQHGRSILIASEGAQDLVEIPVADL